MAKLTKRTRTFREKVSRDTALPIDEALGAVKEMSSAKFAESVDVSVNLGVDPRKSDQVVRGSTVLPHGTGKSVRVAVFAQGDNAKKAEAAGLAVASIADAVSQADIVMVLLPDENQAAIYESDIKDNLKQGASLVFAHGLNIHFGYIEPREDIDVFMAAPKGPGHLVRSTYEQGGGVPCLVAVAQDSSGKALEKAIAYASAVGGGRAGIIETTFDDDFTGGR